MVRASVERLHPLPQAQLPHRQNDQRPVMYTHLATLLRVIARQMVDMIGLIGKEFVKHKSGKALVELEWCSHKEIRQLHVVCMSMDIRAR